MGGEGGGVEALVVDSMIASSCLDAVVLKLRDDERGPGPKWYDFLKHLNAGRIVYVGNAIPCPVLQCNVVLGFHSWLPNKANFLARLLGDLQKHICPNPRHLRLTFHQALSSPSSLSL